jgi:hypothetical protein
MCTDISLGAIDIIRLYGLRFKIEHSFKQAIRLIGSFAYHFWMKGAVAPPQRQSVSSSPIIQLSGSSQTQGQRLPCFHPSRGGRPRSAPISRRRCAQAGMGLVGSWLRTIRPGIPPSELVVAQALRQTLPDFVLVSCKVCALAKFIADQQDTQNMRIFRMSA